MKIVEFSILVEISEGLKKLWFESMYLKLSNSKSRFSIICLRKKKGMFVLKNPSGAPLRGVLTCASLYERSLISNASNFFSYPIQSCFKFERKQIFLLFFNLRHFQLQTTPTQDEFLNFLQK